MRFVFISEIFERGEDGIRRGLAERAERAVDHGLAQSLEKVEVFHFTPAFTYVSEDLKHLFETFTIDIHNLIAEEGKDAFYVFDCLSELEEAWATDLLMGDFFHLTCPFLFQLDTVAFFPVLRGRHSFDAIKTLEDFAPCCAFEPQI